MLNGRSVVSLYRLEHRKDLRGGGQKIRSPGVAVTSRGDARLRIKRR